MPKITLEIDESGSSLIIPVSRKQKEVGVVSLEIMSLMRGPKGENGIGNLDAPAPAGFDPVGVINSVIWN